MITFETQDITFKLNESRLIARWLEFIITARGCYLDEITYIFCSDEYLYDMNRRYLNHDTYTDIITFDTSEQLGTLAGDIFISIDRVRENALTYNEPFERELHRVMAHGILHILGYGDKTPEEKKIMRLAEDKCLEVLDKVPVSKRKV